MSTVRCVAVLLPLLLLSACFKTELGGTVAGASVTITELRTGAPAQDGLKSSDLGAFLATKSQDQWDKLGDLGKMINLGNFFVEKDRFLPGTWYLVTVTGGEDMDSNADGVVDTRFAPVGGTWHAIIKGGQLREGGFAVSPITEALYQSVIDELPQLGDGQLETRLNTATMSMLEDVNGNGTVGYGDALGWSTLFHRDRYLLNFDAVVDLSNAIRAGADEGTQKRLALAVLGQPGTDALQFFTDNISAPIVQSRCINCHTSDGIAPSRGARLVLVTNSNSDHLALNHRAFIRLGELLGGGDLSDHVTTKASAQVSHGGGRQLPPGSTDLDKLETYLNLIE
jgi:hypothetical protein